MNFDIFGFVENWCPLTDKYDYEGKVETQVPSKNYRKTNKFICIILNLLIPISLLFFFKISIKAYILAFLITDILFLL